MFSAAHVFGGTGLRKNPGRNSRVEAISGNFNRTNVNARMPGTEAASDAGNLPGHRG